MLLLIDAITLSRRHLIRCRRHFAIEAEHNTLCRRFDVTPRRHDER